MNKSDELYEFIEKSINLYSDYDIPIWKCIETHLISDYKMDNDDAYNISLILSDFYNKIWK